MPKLLTKTLLRNAAAHMAGDDDYRQDDQTYMCHAVYVSSKDFGPEWMPKESPTVRAFEILLTEHGVSTCGGLVHKKVGHHSHGAALRFDFLNLLAESL
ncbi:hypothetical protein [Variovorax paradoxus]|uniref:hypothetical protein n=1 Tax=Variovorax paradoxus TaxID=34073 RepID=UPI0029C9A2CA|nr:hypothetical protein [Variovorax paradoxus]WPH18203.1 hypothetical protein RZE78_14290 [Variovorax paradoxus]